MMPRIRDLRDGQDRKGSRREKSKMPKRAHEGMEAQELLSRAQKPRQSGALGPGEGPDTLPGPWVL